MMSGRDEAINTYTFAYHHPGSSSSVVQPLPSSTYHHSSATPDRSFPFNLRTSPGSAPSFSSPVHNHYTNSPTPNPGNINLHSNITYPPYPAKLQQSNSDFTHPTSSMDSEEPIHETPVKRTRRRRGEGASASVSAASGSSSLVAPHLKLAIEPGNAASQQQQGPATPVVNIKTKFPVARIKRIMQADEDVGKVAQVTPVIVSKALELFMISLCAKASDQARSRNSKRITAAHLKQAVLAEEQFDFLQEIMSKVPDIPLPTAETSNPGNSDDDDGSGGGGGGNNGPGAPGAGSAKKPRKPRARRQTGDMDGSAAAF